MDTHRTDHSSDRRRLPLNWTREDAAPSPARLRLEASSTVSEGAGGLTVTVVRASGDPNSTVSVGYRTERDNATVADFTPTRGRLTLNPGEMQQSFTIPILEDDLDEQTQYFVVILQNVENGEIEFGRQVVGIEDNDEPLVSRLRVEGPGTVNEDAGTVTFTIRRDIDRGTCTVRYRTEADSARRDDDFSFARDTIEFAVGETSKTVTVPIINDGLVEEAERFALVIDNPRRATVETDRAEVTIVSEDQPPRVSLSAAAEVSESAGQLTVTINRTVNTAIASRVNYAVEAGSARGGSDFQNTSGGFTFEAGESSKTFNIPLINDNDYEERENFFVTLRSGENTTVDVGRIEVALISEDALPQVTVQGAGEVREDVGGVTYTLTRSGSLNVTTSVDYSTEDGSARAGEDFTQTQGSVIFNSGESSKTITVPLRNDTAVEDRENFVFTLRNATAGTITNGRAETAIASEDAWPRLTLSGGGTVAERAGSVAFTVTRSGNLGVSSSVAYSSEDGTARSGEDYSNTSGILNFAAGESSKSFSVSVTDDPLVEETENFTLVLREATGATLETSRVTVSLTSDDSWPSLSLSGPSEVNESVGSATFTIARTGNTAISSTVNYRTENGSARADEDFTALSGTVNFSAGESSKTISVPILNDTQIEDRERFTFILQDVAGGTLGNSRVETTIVSDDMAPRLSVSGPGEISETSGNATFTITRSGELSASSMVSYSTADGSARAGEDYTATSGTLTFASGENSKTVAVPITNDTLVEGSETLALTLRDPAHATLETGRAEATLVSDDVATPPPPSTPATLSVSAPAELNENAGSVSVTISRGGNLSLPSSVRYFTENGSASAGADYTAIVGTVNFSAGESSKTVTVPLLNDLDFEGSESFSFVLRDPINATLLNDRSVISIISEDTQDPTRLIVSGPGTVSEEAGLVNVTITRVGNLSGTSSVIYATSDGSARLASSDYVGGNGILRFARGETTKTLNIRIMGDDEAEDTENFYMNFSNAVGAILDNSRTEISIRNVLSVDRMPEIFFAPSHHINEGVGSVSIEVTRGGNINNTVSVHYDTENFTATSDNDYTQSSGVLTFPPGETRRVISIPIRNDTETETSEVFFVRLSSPENASIRNSTTSVVINNDDALHTYSISPASVSESAGRFHFRVERSSTADAESSINYRIISGTAEVDRDIDQASGTLRFNSSSRYEQFSIAIHNDSDVEGSEAFAVEIYTEDPNARFRSASAMGIILDDDLPPPPVTPSQPTQTNTSSTSSGSTSSGSGHSGGTSSPGSQSSSSGPSLPEIYVQTQIFNERNPGQKYIVIRRRGDTNRISSVNCTVQSATAIEGQDFRFYTRSVTFRPGETAVNIPFHLLNDRAYEGDENFTLQLSNPDQATLASDRSRMIIIDDDPIPSTPAWFTINDVSAREINGSVVFTITRSGNTFRSCSVSYETRDGSARADSDYRSRSGTAYFAAGVTTRTISVPLMNDDHTEGSESFSLVLEGAEDAVISRTSGTAVISDDEQPFPEVSVDAPTVSESANSVTFRFTRAGNLAQSGQLFYSTRDDTASSGQDYSSRSGTVRFAANSAEATVTIPLIDDRSVEANETFRLNLSGATGVRLTEESAVATIIDDDRNHAPTIGTVLSDRNFATSVPIRFTLPATAFRDVDPSDRLAFSAVQSNGSPLPSWLLFNRVSRSFSGRSPAATADLDITVTATDAAGASVSQTFALVVENPSGENEAPEVGSEIPDQIAIAGRSYRYTLPTTAFDDPDGDRLTYTATLQGGGRLPAWLRFAPSSLRFNGVAPRNTGSDLNIVVTASDPDGLSASQTFRLTIGTASTQTTVPVSTTTATTTTTTSTSTSTSTTAPLVTAIGTAAAMRPLSSTAITTLVSSIPKPDTSASLLAA